MLSLDHFVTQAWTIRDKDFQFGLPFFLVFVQKSFVRIQTGLAFCLAGFRSHIDPFQFAFQCLTTFACLLFFLCHTFGLLIQPRRVVSFPGDTFSAVQFQNPSGYMVEEVTVVRNTDNRTRILL